MNGHKLLLPVLLPLFVLMAHAQQAKADTSSLNIIRNHTRSIDSLAKEGLEEDGIGHVICEGEEYYQDGKVIYKILSPHNASKGDSDRLSFSWWDRGNEYLRKYYNP